MIYVIFNVQCLMFSANITLILNYFSVNKYGRGLDWRFSAKVVRRRWCIVIHTILNLEKITLKLGADNQFYKLSMIDNLFLWRPRIKVHESRVSFKFIPSLQNCWNRVPFWIYLVGNRGGNKLDSKRFHARESDAKGKSHYSAILNNSHALQFAKYEGDNMI